MVHGQILTCVNHIRAHMRRDDPAGARSWLQRAIDLIDDPSLGEAITNDRPGVAGTVRRAPREP